MATDKHRLQRLLAQLLQQHGVPAAPSRDPWHLILRENVVYLADEPTRQRAFEQLEAGTDLDAATIAGCPDAVLLQACGQGGMAKNQLAKLRACAELFTEVGDPRQLVDLPVKKAKRQLQRFPGIAAPGAERLLLLAGRAAVLALDSNGLRVLVRLGYGAQAKSYATSYRAAQAAAMTELTPSTTALTAAHLLLQVHGRTICRNSRPACADCAVRGDCPSAES